MNKEEQNIADVEFICQELERFGLMPPQDLMKHVEGNPRDRFAFLDHRTRGLLFCGRAAYDRFEELAERTIKPGSLEANSFAERDYIVALHKAFLEIFIDALRPVSQGSVARFIDRAKQLASSTLVEHTHHIPCTVFYDKNPSKFAVGPVTFTRIERFFEEFIEALSRYQQSRLEAYAKNLERSQTDLAPGEVLAQARTFANTLTTRIRDYYHQYGWVASISIPLCHERISRRRAEQTVDAALDVLRLFVTGMPQRYRRAESPNLPFETRGIVSDSSGRIFSMMSRVAKGGPASQGWHAALLQEAQDLWKFFEEAIESLRTQIIKDELNQRLLDALNWFGQAVVEQNPGAKIVKYTAALERLTMTGHVEAGIETLVIKRVLMLNQDRTDKTEEQIQKDLGELYQCRSDLMHGSLSPYDATTTDVLRIAWEVTRWSILNAARFFALIRENGKADRNTLARVYDGGRRSLSV